ncbi:MAG TPA: DUF4388 domain-containing protein [Ktedonobacteraceae bacterium]
MSQQPKTETDRLANVIQVLQLGQKTGRLIVEHNDGLRFEQGIITFVNGQVVQASLNQFQGPEAFNRLKNWGACRFAFTLEQRASTTARLPALSPPLSPVLQKREAEKRASSGLLLPKQAPGQTDKQESVHSRTPRNVESTRRFIPLDWLAIPYRTRQIEEGIHLIEHMGLSRTHRRLFLLIDGSRMVKELVRLMAHNPEEVQKLLQDLEHVGVIHL